MHATFVQSSLKFNMLHSTKSQLARLYSTKQGTRSTSKNHYDTLNITPRATQNEVKSAYYKLTLQYHPDKNKSDYAKEKFQDISEAYEVLSSHEQRKIYDRSILLRQPLSSTSEEPMSHYRDKVYSGSSKIYNFDAWTQAHYGQQLHAKRIRKQAYEYYKSTEDERRRERDNPRYIEFAVFLFTIMLVMGVVFRENLDVPAHEKRQSKAGSKDN